MSVELSMPRLSDAMEEGTVVRWLKQPGDAVARGESIVEIETDKATVEHEADVDGVLLEILVAEGETVPLGRPLARIGAAGETAARPAASPVARRLASELGVALETVGGSGPNGRIVKADVLAAARAVASAAPPAAAAAPPAAAATTPAAAATPPAALAPPAAVSAPAPVPDGTRYEEATRIQRLVARRMAEASASVPDFALFADVAMDACLELRARLKLLGDGAPSVNDMVVKAAALALRDHPRANGSWREEGFELHERVNVGVAVASDAGLVVPTVADADIRSLGSIAAETRRLAAAVRDGSAAPAELAGGTFTVSNLGMFGVDAFTAIVNPPQAAILSVGAIRRQPVVRDDDTLAVGQVMTVGLVSDHRILNGADAARFLARIRELLEAPLAMTL